MVTATTTMHDDDNHDDNDGAAAAVTDNDDDDVMTPTMAVVIPGQRSHQSNGSPGQMVTADNDG